MVLGEEVKLVYGSLNHFRQLRYDESGRKSWGPASIQFRIAGSLSGGYATVSRPEGSKDLDVKVQCDSGVFIDIVTPCSTGPRR
jgi:hypothetical protein